MAEPRVSEDDDRLASSGPLPRPADLKKYEEISPGAAERIIRAWEADNENRRAVIEDYYDRETRAMRWWRIASFVTLFIGEAYSFYMMYYGHILLGFSLTALFMVGHLAGAYIQGMLLPDVEERAMRKGK